jgi:hypothetical protein
MVFPSPFASVSLVTPPSFVSKAASILKELWELLRVAVLERNPSALLSTSAKNAKRIAKKALMFVTVMVVIEVECGNCSWEGCFALTPTVR